MTFLNDLWKKFKETQPESGPSEKTGGSDTAVLEKSPDSLKKPNEASGKAAIAPPFPVESLTDSLKRATSVLNAFQQVEEGSQAKPVLDNATTSPSELKAATSPLKEDALGLRFTTVKQPLAPAEGQQQKTSTQEQKAVEVYCPKCQSTHLKQLPQTSLQSPYAHRYRCLDCGTEFTEDGDNPIGRVPPLNIWMQCWYLIGRTDSLSYIASQLGLDLAVVEIMIDQLRKTFNIQQPQTQFIEYEEWSKQSQDLRVQLKEDLLRDYERLNANIATVPKDTAEHRRQLNLRRDLTSTTAPPSPKGPRR